MPHINYFRASLFLFLSSFDTQFELYLLHKCINYMLFVRVALIVICSIVFYRMFIFYKVLFVRNDIIHTHCFQLPKCDQNINTTILLKKHRYCIQHTYEISIECKEPKFQPFFIAAKSIFVSFLFLTLFSFYTEVLSI